MDRETRPTDRADPPRGVTVEDVFVVEDRDGAKRSVRDGSRPADDEWAATASSNTETATTTDVGILVSAPGQLDGGPIPANATATVRIGAFDDSGLAPVGVANETLDLTVTRPDGTTESFTRQTGANGTATVSYDLSGSGRGTGEYDFQVSDADAGSVTATTSPRVGPTLIETFGSGKFVFVNETSEFSFLVHDGDDGVSGEDVQVRLVREGTEVDSTTATTDPDGFATASFTPSQTTFAPSQPESYEVEAELGTQVAATSFDAVDRVARGTFALSAARVGETNTYAGYVETTSGYLSNTDVVVRIGTSPTNLLTEQTVTTDESGFFLLDYDVPSDFDSSFLFVRMETTGGDPIMVVHDLIAVADPSDDGGDPPAVQLTASVDDPAVPGETVAVDVEATDEDSPISGQDVEVFLRLGFNGPPLYATTVTTGSDGTATATTTLPNDAPDSHDLAVDVGMQYEGSSYEGGTSAQIQEYDVSYDFVRPTPGATETYSMEATERPSGDSASGIPLQYDLDYGVGRVGTFGTGGLLSGSDGTDEVTEPIPTDVGFQTFANYVFRYQSGSSILILPADHPGDLDLGSTDTVLPGEDAEFSFSTPSGDTVYGIAFGTTPRPNAKTFGTRFVGPGTFTLSVPSQFSGGDDLLLRVWAIDGSGTLYSDIDQFTVGGGSTSVSVTAEDGVPVGGEATISVSAQEVDSLTVEALWTDWTLSSSNPAGGSVTDRIASAGELDVDYGSVQSSVSPSVDISLPNRYVGGTYGIVVTGSDSSGNTDRAMGLLTIA